MNNQQFTYNQQRTKIYKFANQRTIMDVLDALDYRKGNKAGEQVYKGNIAFVINEYKGNKQTEKGFLDKASTKLLMTAILNGLFFNLYPNGYTNYGGSIQQGTIVARVLKVNWTEKGQYCFTIESGVGEKTHTGAIQMKQKTKSVQCYLNLEEALKMAIETLDYIKHMEHKGFVIGKPLYTLLPDTAGSNYVAEETM